MLSRIVFETSPPPSPDHSRAVWVARLARQALMAEAELTPKPGLVDRRGAGAHTDLSLTIVKRSAMAIEPHFCRMATVCLAAIPGQQLRELLAVVGRAAERAMLNATNGSNAHKGAIWILGLLVSAAAMQEESDVRPLSIAAAAQQIASFEDRAQPHLFSHGEMVAKKYGVMGARGEALFGFPHVLEVGLPMLRRQRARGRTEHIARLDTLLSIMSLLDDTCLLYRGGKSALSLAKARAAAVVNAGGSGTTIGRELLQELDRCLLALHLSPGGSADLLAATLFLDAVERRLAEVDADHSWLKETDGTD